MDRSTNMPTKKESLVYNRKPTQKGRMKEEYRIWV